MNCPAAVPTRELDSQVAESRAYEWFRADFLRRHPTGEVMTQYEYLNRTTFAGAGGTPVRIAGKPRITALIDSMSDNFRRHVRFGDFRKPDGVGMVELGDLVRVELLEVTTAGNASSAMRQMREKMELLRGVVSRAGGLSFGLDVMGTPWRPSESQKNWPAVPQQGESARWVCFDPTERNRPPAGVTLYEVHAAPRGKPQHALSPSTQAALRQGFAANRHQAAQGMPVGGGIPAQNPAVAREVADMAKTVGILVAIAAVAACAVSVATPVPGDELAVCSFALGVTRAAVR
jgi:hypothetical protein